MTALRRRLPVLLVVAVALFSAARALRSSEVPGDFLRYHRAGRLVWTGRADRLYDAEFLGTQQVYAEERAREVAERGEDADPLDEHEWKYAPATAVLLAPLGALHPRAAHVLWAGWNGLLVGLLFLFAWRACAQGASGWWMALPALLLLRTANHNLQLGQLNPTAIVPATIGVVMLMRRRDVAAGSLVAFGTVVKFMPGVLALWFAWKRRWRALLVLLGALVLLGWGLPAVVLGPRATNDLHARWMDARASTYTDARIDDVPGHSIKSMVYRTLGGVPFRTGRGAKRVVIDVGVAELPPQTLFRIVVAADLALLLLVLLAARGPLGGAADARGPPEAGAILASLLLVSPEARSPHFLYLALPLAALTYGLVRAFRERLPGRRLALGLAVAGGLLLQTGSSTLLGRRLENHASAVCALGVATALVLAALIVLLRAQRRAAAA